MKHFVLATIGLLLVLAGCRDKTAGRSATSHKAVAFYNARGISLSSEPGGWIRVDIINPWDTTKLLQSLALVHRDSTIPDHLPKGINVVRIPLEKSLVQSTVHIGLLEELQADDAIAGVADAAYIKSTAMQQRLENGTVIDCGTWMNPNLEKIILLQPDAILISPYENGGNYGNITELDIPVIYVADYMESNPLGRAEWMKYYGLLFGKESIADSIFTSIADEYRYLLNVADSIAAVAGRKSVIMDLPFNGAWYVPGTGSSNDIILTDAGAINPMGDIADGKIVPVTTEQVIPRAIDADVWIIRFNSSTPIGKNSIAADFPFASKFKSFNSDEVWVCNTAVTPFYEEIPFHPERALSDLVNILYYPESSDSLNFFHRCPD